MKHLWAKLVGTMLVISGAGFVAGASFIAGGNLTALVDERPGGAVLPEHSERGATRPRVPETPVSSGYVDGVYTGRRESAYYGVVQVQAVAQGGDLVDVHILTYPNDNGTSRSINRAALPRLIRESLQDQGAQVTLVSGATFTSEAFHLPLHGALRRALAP